MKRTVLVLGLAVLALQLDALRVAVPPRILPALLTPASPAPETAGPSDSSPLISSSNRQPPLAATLFPRKELWSTLGSWLLPLLVSRYPCDPERLAHACLAAAPYPLPLDEPSRRLILAAEAAARAQAAAPSKAARDKAATQIHIQNYYKEWAASVICERRQAAARAAAANDGLTRSLFVPRGMNATFLVLVRDWFETVGVEALSNSSFTKTAAEAFVGLWSVDNLDGLVEYTTAMGGVCADIDAAKAEHRKPVHKYVLVGRSGELHTSDGAPTVELTADDDGVEAAPMEQHSWWQGESLVTASVQQGKVVDVSRRFVERGHRQVNDRLTIEQLAFKDGAPTACLRTTMRRFGSSDVLGDIRVRSAWRAMRQQQQQQQEEEQEEAKEPNVAEQATAMPNTVRDSAVVVGHRTVPLPKSSMPMPILAGAVPPRGRMLHAMRAKSDSGDDEQPRPLDKRSALPACLTRRPCP